MTATFGLIVYISALEIVTKLCDVEFARKAKAADFLGRFWDVLRGAGAGNGDKVRFITKLRDLCAYSPSMEDPGYNPRFLRGISIERHPRHCRSGGEV